MDMDNLSFSEKLVLAFLHNLLMNGQELTETEMREALEQVKNEMSNSKTNPEAEEIQSSPFDNLPKLEITNGMIFDTIAEENSCGRENDDMFMNKLILYGCNLQKAYNDKNKLTRQDIDNAAEEAGLIIRVVRCNNDEEPDIKNAVEHSNLRLWADVVLSRTWKHGTELLSAEGFNQKEINAVQNNIFVSTDYEDYLEKINSTTAKLSVRDLWRLEHPAEPVQKMAKWNGPFIDDEFPTSRQKE